jgi:O-antigen ligase
VRGRLFSAIIPGFLFLCLLLGGASAAGLWANALLQLIAVPILFWALITRRTPSLPGRQLLAISALMIAIVLLQLVPLPPGIWTNLPGRDHVREGFELVGQPLPWLPISLAPRATVASLLWLLPALAVLLGILRLGSFKPTGIAFVIVVATALAVLLGTLQIAGGEGSPWYPYKITNYGVTVGFFSNANHMATLLVVSVPFLAGLYMGARSKGRSSEKSAGLFAMLGGFFCLVIVGLFINASLAGLGLMVPVSAASILMMMRKRKPPVWSLGLLALLTAASLAVVFSNKLDNNLFGAGAETDVVSRYTTFTVSADATKDYFPFGSGVGTFQGIYRMYEEADRVTTTYINHVHSDWIEILLETGILGAAVLILFLIWWLRRTIAIWKAPDPDYLARAATIASAAIIAHSLVDYPLRTAAISAVFAACCALMANPIRRATWSTDNRPAPMRPARHLSAD